MPILLTRLKRSERVSIVSLPSLVYCSQLMLWFNRASALLNTFGKSHLKGQNMTDT